jgi:hypothetical protein
MIIELVMMGFEYDPTARDKNGVPLPSGGRYIKPELVIHHYKYTGAFIAAVYEGRAGFHTETFHELEKLIAYLIKQQENVS